MADMTELKNIVRLGTVQSVRCASNGKRGRGADSKNNTEI